MFVGLGPSHARLMNLGFSGEIAFIMLLALVLFGPRKLAEFSRQAGRLMAEFRKASSHLQSQIQAEMGKLETEVVDPVRDLANLPAQAANAAEDTSLAGTLNRLAESITSFTLHDDAPDQKSPAEQTSQQV